MKGKIVDMIPLLEFGSQITGAVRADDNLLHNPLTRFINFPVSYTHLQAYLEESTAPSGDDSLTKIQNKGKLVLGLDDSFPPMGFRDESDTIVGFDIDLATEVAKRMGVTLEVQPIDWDAKEMRCV